MSGWARRIKLGAVAVPALCGEGGSMIVRLLPRFLFRLKSLEERSHFAEAIRDGWLWIRGTRVKRGWLEVEAPLADDMARCLELLRAARRGS